MVMRKHQRYFPVYTQSGQELLPHFITVANGPIHPATVIAGQARPCTTRCCTVLHLGPGNAPNIWHCVPQSPSLHSKLRVAAL